MLDTELCVQMCDIDRLSAMIDDITPSNGCWWLVVGASCVQALFICPPFVTVNTTLASFTHSLVFKPATFFKRRGHNNVNVYKTPSLIG